MKVDKQGPTKLIKQFKTKLRTLKDAYKKAKDNNAKTGTAPMTCPFYNEIDGILGSRDIVKLPEVRGIGVNEDDHINPSGSIAKDTENPVNIFKVNNTHNEEKGTIGKENIAGGNTVADHSEKEADESVIDHENDELNSSFIEALNHEKEKKRVARKRKQDTKSKDDKFFTLNKMKLQKCSRRLKNDSKASCNPSLNRREKLIQKSGKRNKSFFLNLKKSLLKAVNKLISFVSWNFHIYNFFCY